jgi:hypothetical protein
MVSLINPRSRRRGLLVIESAKQLPIAPQPPILATDRFSGDEKDPLQPPELDLEFERQLVDRLLQSSTRSLHSRDGAEIPTVVHHQPSPRAASR